MSVLFAHRTLIKWRPTWGDGVSTCCNLKRGCKKQAVPTRYASSENNDNDIRYFSDLYEEAARGVKGLEAGAAIYWAWA